MGTVYDVTTFTSPSGTSPYNDLGKVINEIIANIKSQQSTQTTRPGATIYIPPGHFTLLTRVTIDIGFLQIKGSGHGWFSQAVRDTASASQQATYATLLPGASHVSCKSTTDNVAFYIYRSPSSDTNGGRISGVEFRDFMIDGGSNDTRPYMTSQRDMTAILAQSFTDSVRIEGMGFNYLRAAIVSHNSDAWSVNNNVICEVGSCIEFRDFNTQNRIQNNFLWSAYWPDGWSVLLDAADGALVTGNHMGWGGRIALLNKSHRCHVASNVIQSYWPPSIFIDDSEDNTFTGNRIDRFGGQGSNGKTDEDGVIHVAGNYNHFLSNTISIYARQGSVGNGILVNGESNYFMMNQLFDYPQAGGSGPLSPITKVRMASSASNTRVIYSGTSAQFESNGSTGTQFVATP